MEDGFTAREHALSGRSTGRSDECIDVLSTSVESWAAEFPIFERDHISARAIVQIAQSRGACALVVSSHIYNPYQIHGLVAPRYSVAYQLAEQFMKQITTQKVLRPVESSEAALEMFLEGSDGTDGIAVCDPYVSLALRRPEAHKIQDLDGPAGNPYVLVATKDSIENAPNILHDFIQEWLDGNQDCYGSPDLVVKFLLDSSEMENVSEEQVRSELERVKLANLSDNMSFFGLDGGEIAFNKIFEEATGKWINGNYLDRGTDPNRAKDIRFIKRIYDNANQSLDAVPGLCLPGAKITTIATEKVNFDPAGSSKIEPSYEAVLRNVATSVKLNSESQVCIEGYTDTTGDDTENDRLSLDRARAVADYLRDIGNVPQNREFTRGLSYADPVASNETEDGRKLNRRAAIRVVKERSGQ